MAQNSIQELLKKSFPKSNIEQWETIASNEIEGKDAIETLQWLSPDAIKFNAYYDKSSVEKLDYLQNLQLKPSNNPYSGSRTWFNLPAITVANSLDANAKALQFLASGADGIFFNCTSTKQFDAEKLLEKIEWPFCHVAFKLQKENVDALIEYIKKKNFEHDSLQGLLLWDELPTINPQLIQQFAKQKKFFPNTLIISVSIPVTEIAEALTKGVRTVESLIEKGINVKDALRSIAFSLPCDTDFFLTIAKFKAMRMLWYQVVQAYGVTEYKLHDLHLHARSEAWTKENFQPRGNMLKSTTAALAAISGGCDSLTVYAEDENNNMMSRIALNVSNILREESHVDKVADPTAGSYALENMISQLAEKAWSKFQSAI